MVVGITGTGAAWSTTTAGAMRAAPRRGVAAVVRHLGDALEPSGLHTLNAQPIK